MTLNDLQRRAFDYFVRMGWTPAQSAGIVANLWAESRLNPAAVGDGGQAYGIAQWHPPRQAGFAALIGKDIHGSTLEEQLAYVHAELQGTEKAAGEVLATCTTATDAGAAVSMHYERPADTEGEAAKRGALAQTILDAVQPSPAAPAPPTGPSMPFLALLPLIAQFVPQIMTLIKPNSQSTAKDAAVAGTILDTVVKAAGIVTGDGQPAPVNAATVGQAAEKMQADPELAKRVQAAVVTHPDVMPLLEVGGGVAAAREADLKQQAAAEPFWKASAVFWISVLLLPLIYWLVGSLIVGGVQLPQEAPWWVKALISLFGTAWNGESRSGGFNLVVGLVLGGICGVYYGISITQQKQQTQATSSVPTQQG